MTGGNGVNRLLLTVTEGALTASVRASVLDWPVPGTPAGGPAGGARRVLVTLRSGRGRPVLDGHLRVQATAPPPWPQLADVVTGPGAAGATLDELAAAHPGAAVVAVYRDGEGCGLRLGPYGSGDATVTLGARQAAGLTWAMWASMGHAWLTAGLPPTALASVRVGRVPCRTPGAGDRPGSWPSSGTGFPGGFLQAP